MKFLFPASLILFADNDRHLIESRMSNKGILKTQESLKIEETAIFVCEPDFSDLKASKETSDWNDLVRLKEKEFAKAQITKKIAISLDKQNV